MKNFILILFIPLVSFSQNEDILLNGSVSVENNQIKNVAEPTDAQDAATKDYVDDNIPEIPENYLIPFISISENEDILLNRTVSAENNQIKNVAEPTDAQDAATKNYVATQFYSQSQVDSIITSFQSQINNLTSYVLDLDFSTAITFESLMYNFGSTGMIGSSTDNSLFISMRENSAERILKINIDTNNTTEKIFDQSDFVTKRLHIDGNQLIVFGGQYVNTYNLDLSGGDPTSVTHGKTLTRFGMTELNGNAYLIGGGLNEDPEKIFSWNIETETLSDFSSLPQGLFSSGVTIVDDYLYVFGGTSLFADPSTVSTTAYKISINDPSNVETFQINQAIDVAFAQRYQNLIYVAGQIITVDSDGVYNAINPTIGVYNTLENTYQVLNTNLTNTSGFDSIKQMCILNGKMYIIYGASDNGTLQQWEVLVSDLN